MQNNTSNSNSQNLEPETGCTGTLITKSKENFTCEKQPQNLLPRTKIVISTPHPCAYLPSKIAISEVLLADFRVSPRQFGKCLKHGYRRSGAFIYRPVCDSCQACISVRIPIKTFSPSRSQKRDKRKFQHLKVQILPLTFSSEHFDLYKRYQNARHESSEMDSDDPKAYSSFVLESVVDSCLIEFRDNNSHLLMVCLIDFTDDGASAVYTFFDPDISGLGIYAVLWQIDWLKLISGQYLYLGYWVEASRKMRYKKDFQPLEQYRNERWSILTTR